MKVVFAKLDEPREPLVVNVSFPVETETGKQSESILTIWFEAFSCKIFIIHYYSIIMDFIYSSLFTFNLKKYFYYYLTNGLWLLLRSSSRS